MDVHLLRFFLDQEVDWAFWANIYVNFTLHYSLRAAGAHHP